MKRKLSFFLLVFGLLGFHVPENDIEVEFEDMKERFSAPDPTIKTSIYWYWISDHISKAGVIADLHAMKKVGINRAFIGNIGLKDVPSGKVKIFSEEWWDILHTALKTATELDIEIGIFNSPGWSQSGGPWVKKEEAMRYLASTQTLVAGPGRVEVVLPKPNDDFQDQYVVAFRAPRDFGVTLLDEKPLVSSMPEIPHLQSLMDGDVNTGITLPANKTTEITFHCERAFTARSLTVYPARNNLKFDIVLQVQESGVFKDVSSFTVDRSNNKLEVGFEQYAPVVASFEAIEGRIFRIVVSNAVGKAGINELRIDTAPRVALFKEKSLARMHPTPLPYWDDYLWEQQAVERDDRFLTDPSEVMNVSEYMDENGVFNWNVPAGEWVILRTGMVPTGVTNHPSSEEGTGLEVDKMSAKHAASHFDAFLGEIQRRIPPDDRKSWKVAVQDSYETGGQNWTDDFVLKFSRQFQYDPVPFIPVLYGHVIGSQDVSDRFLWDLRRFVADNIAYEYVGGLRDVSHKHGLTVWLENYGHWGFPGEFLQYGGQSDEIGGEFWNEGSLGDIECRAASSAAHIYGKNVVYAESFTAGGQAYARYPAVLKKRADRFFTEGINSSLLHVYIHQPYADFRPGVNTGFGTEFNRFNTWYDDMDLFVDYLKRCNFLLQQGRYVADVAYFIGEDTPKMTGVQNPELPRGYSFDYINAEVIEHWLTVKDGEFVLPHGMKYRVLVLPDLETMRPSLLTKIAALVEAGGTVLGPKPSRSPSLQDYGQADDAVRNLADRMWGPIDGQRVKTNTYGKGRVYQDVGLQVVFDELSILPDCRISGSDEALFIHRRLTGGDIYFISNQEERPVSLAITLNVQEGVLEQWNPIDGSTRKLSDFSTSADGITVPIDLAPLESTFIVLKKQPGVSVLRSDGRNRAVVQRQFAVNGKWNLRFSEAFSGPTEVIQFDELIDWNDHSDERIKYYSGPVDYETAVALPGLQPGERAILDLGHLSVIGKVTVNGHDAGGAWTPPYQVDVTDYIRVGSNTLTIKIVNTWVNRLIGDQHVDEAKRVTGTFVNPYHKDSPLEPSGLHGPVRIDYVTN